MGCGVWLQKTSLSWSGLPKNGEEVSGRERLNDIADERPGGNLKDSVKGVCTSDCVMAASQNCRSRDGLF